MIRLRIKETLVLLAFVGLALAASYFIHNGTIELSHAVIALVIYNIRQTGNTILKGMKAKREKECTCGHKPNTHWKGNEKCTSEGCTCTQYKEAANHV